ncbi:MAG: hypothetical protein IJ072_07145, partial [Oscillospiraceae bacterium]|nr:hypothetical protein [Oscillospiraceae bacterium]
RGEYLRGTQSPLGASFGYFFAKRNSPAGGAGSAITLKCDNKKQKAPHKKEGGGKKALSARS